MPSRRSQPYRTGLGTRVPGVALTAMKRGKSPYLNNPTRFNNLRRRRMKRYRSTLLTSIRRRAR